MKISISKNQRDMIAGLNQSTNAALEQLKAAQMAAHHAQAAYEKAMGAVNIVISCIALDAGASPESQFRTPRIAEEPDGIFLILAEPEQSADGAIPVGAIPINSVA